MTQVEYLERMLRLIEERMSFLDRHPTVPGADVEYQAAMRDYIYLSAQLDRVKHVSQS